MVNRLLHENRKSIPKFLSGKKLFKIVTLQTLFKLYPSKLTNKISPIWCNVKFPLLFIVLINAVKTDTKLTLHHMGIFLLFNLPRRYRRSSLSPEDQTKFFEISVVWDSQPVTSFTFFIYMCVELQIACTCINQLCKYPPDRNQYVEIICMFVCMDVK